MCLENNMVLSDILNLQIGGGFLRFQHLRAAYFSLDRRIFTASHADE